jgi:hypothetical protein
MTTVKARSGERHVDLYVPFSHQGREIDRISFKAPTLGLTLRWQTGQVDGILGLMSELSGLPVAALNELRYPDADFVMTEFMGHLPGEVRAAIIEDRIPNYQPNRAPAAPPAETEADRVIREFREKQIAEMPEGTEIFEPPGGVGGFDVGDG